MILTLKIFPKVFYGGFKMLLEAYIASKSTLLLMSLNTKYCSTLNIAVFFFLILPTENR